MSEPHSLISPPPINPTLPQGLFKSLQPFSLVYPLSALSLLFLISSSHLKVASSMSEEVRAGWAVRRYLPETEVCPPGEHGEKTWGQFFACCPDPSRPNVTDSGYRKCDLDSELGDLTAQPQCANSTWTLWTYDSGYFCCDPTIGERGYYYQSTGQLGCGTSSWISTADPDVRNAGNYPQPDGMLSRTVCLGV